MLRLIFVIIILNFIAFSLHAKAPVFPEQNPNIKPHRIIRTCCSFGTEMRLFAIPGVALTEITEINKIGVHHYLGDESEKNGIIYTRRGGFIDMGHLRDQSDWMAFLYNQLLKSKPEGKLVIELGHEGGEKLLTARIPSNMTDNDLISLAGKIAYDLSVWHEIATWFGASTIPFVPERYSSFSIEDAYSNLLGVTIGTKALLSELPYEEAVTKLINETLTNLDAVSTEAETRMAMEDVRNIWWTREKRLPSGKVLLQRQLDVYPCLQPWLVPGWAGQNQQKADLEVTEFTSNGVSLDKYYQLEFTLNYKFPFRKVFHDRKNRTITQNDFEDLIARVREDLEKGNSSRKKL